MIKRFDKYVKEELDAVTVGLVGSGTAITGYPTGTWTPSAGVSVYGGDSESAFASNSAGAKGMEQEVVIPPKNIFREPKKKKNRKNKKERDQNRIARDMDELDRPIMKVSEGMNQKPQLSIICKIKDKNEAIDIVDKIKETIPIPLVIAPNINNLHSFPDWLFIDMYYPKNEIQINAEPYNHYSDSIINIWLGEKDYDSHLYEYEELDKIIKSIKTYFDIPITPSYNPRRATRTLESINESKTKDQLTVLCRVENREEVFLIMDKIKKSLPTISTDYNGALEGLTVYPNWLFIDMNYIYNEIFVNYWGDSRNHERNLQEVTRTLARSIYMVKHMYDYNELGGMISRIKEYFDIPIVPNYSPKRITRTLENNTNDMITKFKTFESVKSLMTPKPIDQIQKDLQGMPQDEKNIELVMSIIRDHTDIAKLLIENGADVNSRDELGWTALMWATQRGHTKIAKMIIDKGADVNADYNGQTALKLSKPGNWGRTDIEKLLIDAGAKK